MTTWRLWWRKVVTGVAAILVVGFQMFGSVTTPVGQHENAFQYAWSDTGIRATWLEEQPFVRLRGEVREEQVRGEQNSGRNKRREAAS